ncbi:hypothetical protein HQ584_03980 [Patescibacteria group bacterium]|nr:hypothetical protein [Patescibacteria group bacterium]
MRTLIYVPVIHMSADLGSIAKAVNKRGIAGFGEEFWKKHRDTVSGFWDTITDYFSSIKVTERKIYQDGMVADKEVGEKIIEEGIKSGSKNYELLSRLLKRGVILVKTEDFNLVKEERDRIVKITQAKTTVGKLAGFIRYKLAKNRLLKKRDSFIAKRIDETLNQGETGILFIGAYHNIKTRLLKDIQIIEVKDTDKVREYQRLLLFHARNKSRFEELGKYLISPINLTV